MPSPRKPRRRRTLTDEELAALRERNAQLLDRAGEALNDPGAVAGQIRTGLASGYSGRLLRYSLRNQILLAQQAEGTRHRPARRRHRRRVEAPGPSHPPR